MNPFRILHLLPGATPHQILKAAMDALKKQEFSSREIALAQKMLMDPVSRDACSFLCHWNILGDAPGKITVSAGEKPPLDLTFLPLFSEDK